MTAYVSLQLAALLSTTNDLIVDQLVRCDAGSGFTQISHNQLVAWRTARVALEDDIGHPSLRPTRELGRGSTSSLRNRGVSRFPQRSGLCTLVHRKARRSAGVGHARSRSYRVRMPRPRVGSSRLGLVLGPAHCGRPASVSRISRTGMEAADEGARPKVCREQISSVVDAGTRSDGNRLHSGDLPGRPNIVMRSRRLSERL